MIPISKDEAKDILKGLRYEQLFILKRIRVLKAKERKLGRSNDTWNELGVLTSKLKILGDLPDKIGVEKEWNIK